MSKFCIVLGEGVRVSPAAYLAALKLAQANPTMLFRRAFQDPRGWMGAKTGAEIVQEYKRMLADRWAERTMAQHVYGKGNASNRRSDALRQN